nr:membrane protein insertion efficiency factor YidD [bacterium]
MIPGGGEGRSDAAPTVGASMLLALIHFYRRRISPYSLPSCRFTPTCSRYALDAVQRYGALR